MQVTQATDPHVLPAAAKPTRQHVKRARRPRPVPENMTATIPIDKRTRVGRDVAAFRAALLSHVGDRPSVTVRAMVDLACQLRVRLVAMDCEFVEGGGAMTAHDSRTYLAWANSLGRLLGRLGVDAPPTRLLSPAEAMAQPYGQAAA